MKKFKKTYIEITNQCNLSCGFCPKTSRPAAFMTEVLFTRILEQMQGRTRFLYFHIMGEPLLHPQLSHFLDLCDKYDFQVNITTNGTLIDKAGELLISKPALRQINFSLHSFEANAFDCPMDQYLDRIFAFVHKAQQERSLLICLRLWNLSEQKENENNMLILQQIQNEFGLDFVLAQKLTECKGIKLRENLFLNQANTFDWPDIHRHDLGERGFCQGLRDQIGFLVDGTAVPCCLDGEGNIALGNIQQQSLDDIIEGDRAKSLYEGFSGRKAVESLCRRCGYRQRFDG